MALRAQFHVLMFFVLGLLFSFNATFASPCLLEDEEILPEEMTDFFEAFNPIPVEEIDQALSVARIELQKILENLGSSGSNFEESLNLTGPRMESLARNYFQKLGSNTGTRTRLNEMALQELNQFLSRSDLNPHQLLTALMFRMLVQEEANEESENQEKPLSPEIYQRLAQMGLSSTDSGFKNYAIQLLLLEKTDGLSDPIIDQVLKDHKPSNSLLITVFKALENKAAPIPMELSASMALHLKRILKKLMEDKKFFQTTLTKKQDAADENENGDEGSEKYENQEFEEEDSFIEGENPEFEREEALLEGLGLFTKMASHSLEQNSEDSSFYLSTLSEISSSILNANDLDPIFSEAVFENIANSASPKLLKRIINNHQVHLSKDHKSLQTFVYGLLQPYLSRFRDHSDSSGLHLVESQISKDLEKKRYWEVLSLITYLPSSADWQQLRLQTLNRILSKLDDDGKSVLRGQLIRTLTALMPENGLQILDDHFESYYYDINVAREVFDLKNSRLETSDLRRLLELSRYVRLDYFVPKLFQIMEKPSESLERRKLAWSILSSQNFQYREDIKQRIKSVIGHEAASFDNERGWQSPRGIWLSEMIEGLPKDYWRLDQPYDDEW